MTHGHRWAMWSLFALVSVPVTPCRLPADEIRPEFAMDHDPEFVPPVVKKQLQDDLLPLWREVLARPEADYQRLAADAIASAAEEGFPGMEPARDDLLRVLTAEETHPAARFTAARALIALDARITSQALFEVSQSNGSQLRWLIEPVLAEWEFEPIRTTWQARIRDRQTNRRELLMALDGLARAQDADALRSMLDIVHSNERPPDVRLAAARAAGAVAETGLQGDAEQLCGHQQATVLQRLCAVALLARHSSELAREQLLRLGRDEEPTVAEQALGRLLAIDPELVLPLAEEAMQNADPKVRRRGADAFVALPTTPRVATLSSLLDDPHPDVRRSVRDDLYVLAQQPDLSVAVRQSARNVLQSDGWRGQEQASLLLGALDEEPATDRLLELLHANRPEVMIASAWALRVLAVADTLPELLAHTQHQTTHRRAGSGTEGLDRQVAHLFEAFALMKYAAAEPLLREYVPKDHVNGYYSRGAAIWALGVLHAGTPDEDLAQQFVGRINDMDLFDPELGIVREMSAISLGRMHATSQLSVLRERLGNSSRNEPVAGALGWAIGQITGEPLPDPAPIIRQRAGWFLEPLPPVESDE